MADRDRPTGGRRDEGEGFLRRWSRRKAEARSAVPPVDDASDSEAATARSPEAAELDQATLSPLDPEGLPDIDSLDASSDFTAFMRPGVPGHLRALALRKLWRCDPIFSKLDGLVEYGEDYTTASWPKDAVKTAYRIGRGFADQLDKLEAAVTPESKARTVEAVAGAEPEGRTGKAATPEGHAAAPDPDTAPSDDLPDAPSESGPGAPEDPQPASAVAPDLRGAGAAAEPDRARRPRPLPRRG